MTESGRERTLRGWEWRGAALVFLGVFLSAACLHHPRTGWNVNTRLDLVFAVVDQGTLSIDAYHDTPPYDTGDKAFFEGRFYSDKIFGVSLLALPFYAGLKGVLAVAGAEPTFQAAHRVMRIGAVSAPGAVAAALLWLLLVRLGAPPRRAVLATAFAVFGTMWFGYSTVFYPYAPGMACCLGALWVVLCPPAKRLTARNTVLIAFLCGYALLCDLIFNLAVAGLAVVYLLRLLDQMGLIGLRSFADMQGFGTTPRRAAGFLVLGTAAGLAPLMLFALYCYSIFGSPTIPYEYEYLDTFRVAMSHGVMGVGLPKLSALWFLTVHPFRGVFFWSPVVVLALVGLVLGTRSSGRRRLLGWLGLYVTAAYLLFNAGYWQWWGGWGMGSRFLLPMLTFVPLGLAEACRRDRPQWLWWAMIALGCVSVALSLPLSLVDPQIPQGNEHAVLMTAGIGSDLAIPQFVYWRAFYTGGVFYSPEYGFDWMRALSFLGALFLAIAALALAARQCPEKWLDHERLELPFAASDGTAAPPPVP